MKAKDTQTPRRKWWRIAAWFMSCTFTLLLLAIGGAAWWLWGQWNNEPDFHESWTPQERAALTELNTFISQELPRLIYRKAAWENLEHSPGIALEIAIALKTLQHAHPILMRLHDITQSGNAAPNGHPVTCGDGFSNYEPSIFAAQIGHLDALKALINHGADPNAVLTRHGTPCETPFTPLLCGIYPAASSPSLEERLQVLRFLVEKGANLNTAPEPTRAALKYPLEMRDDPEPWLRALDLGKTVSVDEFCDILDAPAGMPLVERILREKLVDVNDTTGERTPLQALAEALVISDSDELDSAQYDKRLDMLLAAGADPTLLPDAAPDSELPLSIMLSRTDFERADGMPENACCLNGNDIRTRWQIMCDRLRATPLPTTSSEQDDETHEADEEQESDEAPLIEIN
ncbi:MAG: hypothetical protein IKJ58_03590 [Akkermansia sp.]|nr:hypothetical protein [Akkermansia sp.]